VEVRYRASCYTRPPRCIILNCKAETLVNNNQHSFIPASSRLPCNTSSSFISASNFADPTQVHDAKHTLLSTPPRFSPGRNASPITTKSFVRQPCYSSPDLVTYKAQVYYSFCPVRGAMGGKIGLASNTFASKWSLTVDLGWHYCLFHQRRFRPPIDHRSHYQGQERASRQMATFYYLSIGDYGNIDG
jgi:hypothetical protein